MRTAFVFISLPTYRWFKYTVERRRQRQDSSFVRLVGRSLFLPLAAAAVGNVRSEGRKEEGGREEGLGRQWTLMSQPRPNERKNERTNEVAEQKERKRKTNCKRGERERERDMGARKVTVARRREWKEQRAKNLGKDIFENVIKQIDL